MFIVIVGCSGSGYYLCKALISGGHEVVVVEREPSRFQLLTDATAPHSPLVPN
jgi:Trk K+ transport system NAD-binding subunit